MLTPLLRERLSPVAACREVARGPLGNGQETWFVTAVVDGEPVELVVRRTAAGGPLEWTDRTAEAKAMTAAAGVGLPVPRVRWVDPGGGPLGRPYLVMDRAPGAVAARAAGQEAVAVAADLGRWLARLHAAGLHRAEGPQDAAAAVRDELSRWHDRYRRDRAGPLPQVGALLAWLAATVPSGDEPAVLLWGDPGPHNALHDGGRVTALLDWELAHAGHPLEDVGAAVWMLLGSPDAANALIEGYEAERGPVDRAALDWFVTLACVTRSIMVVTGGGAYAAGRTANPALGALALSLAAEQLALAMDRAGWGGPDQADQAVPADAAPADAAPADAAPADPASPAAPADPAPALGGLRPTAAEVDGGVARFLRDEVLPAVADPHLRRGLKTAAALLETGALRAGAGNAERRRGAAERALLDDLAAAGLPAEDVEEAAERLESGEGDSALRDRVRRHLVADLAAQRGPLEPLRRLFGRG